MAKLTDKSIRSAFSKISKSLVGLDYLDNSAKQLTQTAATFGVVDSDEDQSVNWNLVISEYNKNRPVDQQINHKSFIAWLGSDKGDSDTGRVMIAYLVSRLSTSLARIAVLTTLVLEDVLDETGLTYAELVAELGITCPNSPDEKKNHAMSSEYFQAMQIATREVMATRGYEAGRDIFAKAKTGKDCSIALKLGK